jgi:hypothetical protein
MTVNMRVIAAVVIGIILFITALVGYLFMAGLL